MARAASNWRASSSSSWSSLRQLLLRGPDRPPLLGDLVVQPAGLQPDQDVAPPHLVPLADVDLDDPPADAGAQDLAAARR